MKDKKWFGTLAGRLHSDHLEEHGPRQSIGLIGITKVIGQHGSRDCPLPGF